MDDLVRFIEVGPRDGLQNEVKPLAVAQRVEMIEALVEAGAGDIEIGSFVHPKWIPQMAGTDEVARRIRRQEGVRYWALVPNIRGLERAQAAGVEHIALFMSATEAHNQSNLNRSIDKSLAALEETARLARGATMTIRAYLSVVFGCPFEGEVDFDRVLRLGERLLAMGADHLALGDTIGAGGPRQVRQGCRRAVAAFGADKVALHLHDTQGLALANAMVAWEEGVRLFDGAVGGMGGCPYAPGASGNVASEDLLNLLQHLGAASTLEIDKLCEVARWLRDEQGYRLGGRYVDYWLASQEEK